MSERLDWFACYPSKWLGALAGLKPDQGLIYSIVLLRIYEKRGPIPDTAESIARRVGYRPTHTAKVIEQLCYLGKLKRLADGTLTNPFAESEIAKGEEISSTTRENKSRAGKISAEKRKQKQSQPEATVQQKATPLHLQQESLFSNENSAPEPEKVAMASPPLDAEADYYRRGREVLGQSAGGMLTKLLVAKGRNLALARAALEQASTRGDAREYVGAMVRNGGSNEAGRNGSGYRAGFAGLSARLRYGSPETGRTAAESSEPPHRR